MKKLLCILSVLIVILTLAAPVAAQTVVNPTTVVFTASADHATLGLDGQPLVTNYELRIYVQTPLGQTPAFVSDIGKPTPGAANVISVLNAAWFTGLTPNVKYIARVVAIGPTGEGVSNDSNPFGNQGPHHSYLGKTLSHYQPNKNCYQHQALFRQ